MSLLKLCRLHSFKEIEIAYSFFRNILFCYIGELIMDAELTHEALVERFPMWNEVSLLEVRAQFLTFDVKQDGIIDFQEL